MANKMKLSAVQQKAAEHTDGPLLLISCPGSGKTTTVIERVVNMVQKGISPASILVVTFTKKAADEMAARYQDRKKQKKSDGVTFSTIHSFCNMVIQNETTLTQESIISSDRIKVEVIKKAIREMQKRKQFRSDIRDWTKFIQTVILEISVINNSPDFNFDTFRSKATADTKSVIQLYRFYENWKTDEQKLDFDDMLKFTYELFSSHPDILKKYQDIYRYILVDEFQDTNELQREILYQLAGTSHNLCVVGDDDQSIYRFRGARPSIMLNFPKDFSDCTTLSMTTNYRSGSRIVDASKNLIGYNTNRFEKGISAGRNELGTLTILPSFSNKLEEAKAIVSSVKDHFSKGVPYSEIAVLFRKNRQCQCLARAFMDADIPAHSNEKLKSAYEEWIFTDIRQAYRLVQGKNVKNDEKHTLFVNVFRKFFPFIKKDFLCSMNESEILSRIDNSEMSEWQRKNAAANVTAFFSHIKSLALKTKPSDFLKQYLYEMKYWEYLRKYSDDMEIDFQDFQDLLDFYLAEAASYSSFEEWNKRILSYNKEISSINAKQETNGVSLYTMHSSKGLQWHTVYIAGANDQNIPGTSCETIGDLEEERRLFYVAVTRAKNNLFIYSCAEPSPFIKQLYEKKGYMTNTASSDKSFLEARELSSILNNEKPVKGSRVRHERYGLGRVIAIQGIRNPEYLITFENDNFRRIAETDVLSGKMFVVTENYLV